MTKNFHTSEFRCKCGCNIPELDVLDNLEELMNQLQCIRDYFGVPITINSGYRCVNHNKAIGGVKRSQHVLGKAADIVVAGMTPDEVADEIEYMIRFCGLDIGGLGRYNTFTHIDIRNDESGLIEWDKR